MLSMVILLSPVIQTIQFLIFFMISMVNLFHRFLTNFRMVSIS
jgi:hypothetical protein